MEAIDSEEMRKFAVDMDLLEIDSKEFADMFPAENTHIYNTAAFAYLNRGRCGRLSFLAFRDSRLRGGLVLGLREGDGWCSPFSAPFGGLVVNRWQRVNEIEEMYRLAARFAGERGLRVTLPPEFMDADLYAKSVNVLTRLSGGKGVAELSYHVDLRGLLSAEALCNHAALKNLRRAGTAGFTFERLGTDATNIGRVYDVIRQNRDSHGYVLRMSLEQVVETSAVVPMELFLLSLGERPAASALVYRIAPRVVQVVYWGDMPGFSDLRPMNLLPVEIFNHYISCGDVDFIDIGPAALAAGTPNYGLCRFKESIGCIPSVKWSFTIK